MESWIWSLSHTRRRWGHSSWASYCWYVRLQALLDGQCPRGRQRHGPVLRASRLRDIVRPRAPRRFFRQVGRRGGGGTVQYMKGDGASPNFMAVMFAYLDDNYGGCLRHRQLALLARRSGTSSSESKSTFSLYDIRRVCDSAEVRPGPGRYLPLLRHRHQHRRRRRRRRSSARRAGLLRLVLLRGGSSRLGDEFLRSE